MSASATQPIDATTRLCGVVGHPVRHSASPAMQNAGIEALGLNWRYLAVEVHPSELKAAIAGAKAMKFVGLNLTVPHKELALGMMDVLDEKALFWGAVNTVVFETRAAGGEWIPLGRVPAEQVTEVRSKGYNTDADAVLRDIKQELDWPDLREASVLVLGAGGAARAAAVRLAQEGIGRLFILNRTASRAKELASELTKHFPKLAVATGMPGEPVDLILNATSLGLKPDDSPPIKLSDLGWLQAAPQTRFYDMIYRPAETAFLRIAREAGFRTANGMGMLLYGGAASQELWSGRPAAIDIMRAALKRNIYG